MAEKVTVETIVTTTEIAAVLGISIRRVQQLTQDGVFPTASRGHYVLASTVQRYIRSVSVSDETEEDRKREKTLRISEAQIKASKAALARMEVDELRGQMHRAEDVEAITEDFIYTIRGGLMALPGRLAVDVAAANTPAEASEIIRREVHKLMRELSQYHYDRTKYAERVRERREWETDDDAD